MKVDTRPTTGLPAALESIENATRVLYRLIDALHLEVQAKPRRQLPPRGPLTVSMWPQPAASHVRDALEE